MIEVSNQSSVSSYQYNGLGDRLSQTVDGIVTDYTLDLNTGLTQVLYDGTNTYTYGLGRIAQTDTTTEYFLGDALGSVRQMTDQAGAITFAQTYDPYGVVTQSSGLSHTDYGFTGESYSPSTQLTYLRARYYNPADGRFQSRDTWNGNYNRPMSFNKWNYTDGNPINRTDHSGECWYGDYASGEIRIDPFLESSGPCSWFVNLEKTLGRTVTTQDNWVRSLPLEVASYLIQCNSSVLENSDGYWMVIKYTTSSKWKYYESTSSNVHAELAIGLGFGGTLNCDSKTGTCSSAQGSVILGEAVSFGGLKVALAWGASGIVNFNEGTTEIGGTVKIGNLMYILMDTLRQ
jgi:RHS repeat-associated protein